MFKIDFNFPKLCLSMFFFKKKKKEGYSKKFSELEESQPFVS